MSRNEQCAYIPAERKIERKQRWKERQKSNKRKAYQAEEEEDEGDEGPWMNFTAEEWLWSFFSILITAVAS